MPFGAVQLIPGTNVEQTPTALRAGIATSAYIRFRDGLVQKYGGWQPLYGFNVGGVPRDMHAWQDLNAVDRLLVGATSSLNVLTAGSIVDITPQQFSTNTPPNFIATSGTVSITVTDSNVGTLVTYDSVYLNTPVSIGGIVLSGLYPIDTVVSAGVYKINAATAALSSASATGTLPIFATTTSSVIVTTTFTTHGLVTGDSISFLTSTSVGAITVVGSYPVTTVDADHFTFNVNQQAASTASATMNGGNVAFLYFLVVGPPATGAGYGTGTYGAGGYGTGTGTTDQTGFPITATDWTSDNWGRIALACPRGGPIYSYDPNGGFLTSQIVETAPPFNNGIFVSSTLQILFAWGSTATNEVGQYLDPMLIAWSDIGDYTNFATSDTNQAGNFRIPIGSVIRGGMSAQNQNLFWTDLDLWVANYAGFPLVFGFNKIGAGAGLISSHAAQPLRGDIYWMGPSNFYKYGGGGVSVVPCPMWDYVYQNINMTYAANVRSMPNTPYNEAGWLFPSAASSNGECDLWVKMNISEPGQPWDGGAISRTAWIDQTVLGNPIGASESGYILQHETGNDAQSNPIPASFTTGMFYITEGEDFAFVDQIIPDFIWGTYGSQATGSAQIQMTFNVTNYPGDAPASYGPYLVTEATEYISVRFRGRQMSITVESNDVGSFWRLGRVRFRFAPAGRR